MAEYIDSTKIDFTLITETWLQDNEIDQVQMSTTTFNNSNYKISTENCKIGKGGGTALVMSDKYYVKKLDKSTTYDSFEHAICSTRKRNKDYTLIGIYHPPQGAQQGITNSIFITEFTEFLTEVTSKHNEYEVERIILGPYISDHQFITIQLTECKPKVQQVLTNKGEYQII